MKHLTIICCLFFVLNINAQTNYNSNDFQVTVNDLEQNVYSKDSTANALIIREIGNSYFDNDDFKLKSEVEKKLKILNKNGFNHAEIAIPLYVAERGREERVEDFKATVYNIEDGEITKTNLNKSSIFEEAYNENYKVLKVAFPKVKEGSVIVYSYTIVSTYMYKYRSWEFQSDIPKLYSEYNASIPGNYEYNIKLVGGHNLIINESAVQLYCLKLSNGGSANCGVYKYAMKDVPAFIEEDYMTTKSNYLARIEYELRTFRSFTGKVNNITKDWNAADNEVKRSTDLGKELKKSHNLKDELAEHIVSTDNTLEKATQIFKHVQEQYTWNNKLAIFNDTSIKDLIKNKSGTVGDINALLYALLKDNGIRVEPIILSTRNNGFATQIYPVIYDFNYLIVKAEIDDQTYLLDATDKFVTFGEIPFRCLNQYGRLLDFDDGSKWYDISIDNLNLIEYSYELDLDNTETLSGNVDFKATGYHGLSERRAYFTNPKTYVDAIKNKYNTLELSNFEATTETQTEAGFDSAFKIEKTAELIGNTTYLNPILFKYFDSNPFQLQERSYPVDFGYKDTYIYKIRINIDDTYTIKEIPEPVNMTLPDRSASLLFSVQNNENQVTVYFKLSFNKAIYEPEYYEALKSLMVKVMDVQDNSLIVLEKKE